jgi:hypothetical protein
VCRVFYLLRNSLIISTSAGVTSASGFHSMLESRVERCFERRWLDNVEVRSEVVYAKCGQFGRICRPHSRNFNSIFSELPSQTKKYIFVGARSESILPNL